MKTLGFKEFIEEDSYNYNEMEVANLYFQRQLSVREISKQTDRSIGEIYRILNRHGGPNRRTNNHSTVLSLADSNLPLKTIADMSGYTLRHVRNILKMTDYIAISDILFVYSGGSSNTDPSKSLGGVASVHQIQGTINNLFPNITEEQQEDGYIDYRCFYLSNDSSSNTLYETTSWVTEVEGGSNVFLGTASATDAQKVSIVGPISSGSFTLSYEGTNFTVNQDPDSSVWAQNFQDAMNNLDDLSGVVVAANPSGSNESFDIEFRGADDNRNQGLLELVSNDLVPPNTITIEKVTTGKPINTEATKIATPTTAPAYVNFGVYTESSPLTVGNIKPGDKVPFWIKRTTLAGTEALRSDGFGFRIVGKPF